MRARACAFALLLGSLDGAAAPTHVLQPDDPDAGTPLRGGRARDGENRPHHIPHRSPAAGGHPGHEKERAARAEAMRASVGKFAFERPLSDGVHADAPLGAMIDGVQLLERLAPVYSNGEIIRDRETRKWKRWKKLPVIAGGEATILVDEGHSLGTGGFKAAWRGKMTVGNHPRGVTAVAVAESFVRNEEELRRCRNEGAIHRHIVTTVHQRAPASAGNVLDMYGSAYYKDQGLYVPEAPDAHFRGRGRHVLVTELAEGGELGKNVELMARIRDVVDPRPKMRERELGALMLQYLTGLAGMHTCNMAHRDIKAENALLTRRFDELSFTTCADGKAFAHAQTIRATASCVGGTDVVKVMDFGLSRRAAEAPSSRPSCSSPRRRPDQACWPKSGTMETMAPENNNDGTFELKPTDVYSVGAMWFKLLFGFHVIEEVVAKTQQHREGCDDWAQHRRLACFRAAQRVNQVQFDKVIDDLLYRNDRTRDMCSDELKALLSRMLKKNPADRPTVPALLELVHPYFDAPQCTFYGYLRKKPMDGAIGFNKRRWFCLTTSNHVPILHYSAGPSNDGRLRKVSLPGATIRVKHDRNNRVKELAFRWDRQPPHVGRQTSLILLPDRRKMRLVVTSHSLAAWKDRIEQAIATYDNRLRELQQQAARVDEIQSQVPQALIDRLAVMQWSRPIRGRTGGHR